jgi:MFS family permease
MTNTSRLPGGFFGFTIVWLGQIISVLATSMTQFAVTIWVFEKTGSYTALGLVQVFFITPFLLLSPIAGAMVDRYDRKLMMMVSDLSAGLGTIFILVMQSLGRLEVWHLYVTAAIAGLGNCFQWPAYSAAISTMLPKEQYGRANGMMSLVEAGPGIFAPLLAGALLPLIGLAGILWLDVLTFLVAIGALLLVHIPTPTQSAEGQKAAGGSLLQDAVYGFRYIFARPSLVGLQLTFFFGNLFAGIAFTVLAPMILARTGNSEAALSYALSAGALGGVVSGMLMSVWGGFKRRVHGVLLGWVWSGLVGMFLLGLGRDVAWWAVFMFLGALPHAIINGSNQAIYQAKVPPDVQGRVFAARRLIAWFTNPISPVIGGALADFLLEPGMRAGGWLTPVFGGWVGEGPGAGAAVLLLVCGLAAALGGAAGYFVPVIRDAETLLPDHDAAPAPVVPAAAD